MRAPTLALVAVAVFVLGVTLSCVVVSVVPILSGIYRNHGSQGAAYGIYNTLYSVGLSVGPFVGAGLAARLPLPAIFLLQAAVLTVMGVLGWFVIGRLGWR